jgi:hypothetical protein
MRTGQIIPQMSPMMNRTTFLHTPVLKLEWRTSVDVSSMYDGICDILCIKTFVALCDVFTAIKCIVSSYFTIAHCPAATAWQGGVLRRP